MYDIRGHPSPINYYKGAFTQRGAGLGGLLASLGRLVAPTLKNVGKAVGKKILHETINTSAGILGDVMSGSNIKSATKKRVKRAGRKLMKQATNKLSGKGLRNKRNYRKKQKSRSKRNMSVIPGLGKVYKKRTKQNRTNKHRRPPMDIFD